MAALEMQEPELDNDLEVDEDGNVTGQIRIVRNSECCGDEMKEANFEIDWSPDAEDALKLEEHKGEGHSLSVDQGDPEGTEEGGGRYAKSFFGAQIDFSIRCECQPEGAEPLVEYTWSDKIAASEMDDLT
jgi:hypothetical protein